MKLLPERIRQKNDVYDEMADMSAPKPETSVKVTAKASGALGDGYTTLEMPKDKPAFKTSDGPTKNVGKPWRPKGAR